MNESRNPGATRPREVQPDMSRDTSDENGEMTLSYKKIKETYTPIAQISFAIIKLKFSTKKRKHGYKIPLVRCCPAPHYNRRLPWSYNDGM